MCDPISLAVTSFMVSAGSSVMQYQAANEQADAQNQLYANNAANAKRSYTAEMQQNGLRMEQERDAAGEKSFDNMLDTRAKVATATVGAGEAGVTGLSVESLINDIYGAGGRTNDRIKHNEEMTLTQLATEQQGIEARRIDRTNSVKKGVAPSSLALGLNIASAGLNAGTSYMKMTK
jgi:hypothetical protein